VPRVILACGFLTALCGLAAIGELPMPVAALYLVASVLSLIAYRADKSASQTQSWRTPEARLHLLAVVGGWPGALLAQRLFRHKSRKAAFQWVFWGTVVLNCGALGALWRLLER
jgi:uncharacterized membrane protein YsdA (DUF1294 family)